jgi:hypothetical protein
MDLALGWHDRHYRASRGTNQVCSGFSGGALSHHQGWRYDWRDCPGNTYTKANLALPTKPLINTITIVQFN